MTSRSTIVGITRQNSSEPDYADNGEGRSVTFASDKSTEDSHSAIHLEPEADAKYEQSEHDDWNEPNTSYYKNLRTYLLPSALGIIMAGWTGYFVWAHRAENLQFLTNDRFIGLLGSWSLPASLIGVAWLLAMRNSSAEAGRFADVAASLRKESEILEVRMRTVNEEITLARGFLAENARELESVGRLSASRLQEAAEQLGLALSDSDIKAKILEQVSSAATSNLEQLRKHLPVVTSAAKDVTNQIGNAGNSAQLQVKTLIAALQRVAEAGQTARGNIDGLEERAGEASIQLSHLINHNTQELKNSIELASVRTQQLSAVLGNASEKLTDQLQDNLNITQTGVTAISNVLEIAAKNVQNQLLSSTSQASERTSQLAELLDAAVQNVADKLAISSENIISKTQNIQIVLDKAAISVAEKLNESGASAEIRTHAIAETLDVAVKNVADHLQSASARIDEITDRNIIRLTQQVEMLRESLESMKSHSQTEDARIDAMIERTTRHINEKTKQLAHLDDISTERTAKLAFSVEALVASTNNLNDNLGANHISTDALIERSERLLLALDTANREIDEGLPAALSRADARLIASLSQLDQATQKAGKLDEHSDNMLAKLMTIESLINTQRETVNALMLSSDDHFSSRQEQINLLTAALSNTKVLMSGVADQANNDLIVSINRVRNSTQEAADESRKLLEVGMSDIAERLSEQSRIALTSAIDGQVIALNDVVQQSFERNIALSEAATQKIAAQLSEIDTMTGNLETRLNHAREGFGGIDEDSFARQMVTLTESLNSTAIDVAKILSNDVTDTSWAAYLKGDRGVFTRRAVRLLDTSEAKMIVAHYGDEPEFRAHVNRYIHDFEAMMRVLLSTRDGNAIGITLLSSDVGKLYVALAQAIERLRN